jgi:hypothetical protein
MYDIVEKGVTVVEGLENLRQPYPDMEVLYFIDATKESVAKVVEDYTATATRERMYGHAHLYFASALSDDLFATLKGCAPLLQRMKTLQEVNCGFLCTEAQAFSLDLSNDIQALCNSAVQDQMADKMAERLVCVCAMLHEFPLVRYSKRSPLAVKISNLFQQKMNLFVGKNDKFQWTGQEEKNGVKRGTLVILSRFEDMISPLMHELTYQAMVNDLLPIEKGKLTYMAETGTSEGKKQTQVLLNESDKLWRDYRHKHIADVMLDLGKRTKDLTENNKAAQMAQRKNGESISIEDMVNIMKKMPEYKEIMAKVMQHMCIAKECDGMFKNQKLMDPCLLEQSMATGSDDEGAKTKTSALFAKLREQLQMAPEKDDRARMAAIFLLTQDGIHKDDRDELMRLGRLTEAQKRAIETMLSLQSNSKTTKSVIGKATSSLRSLGFKNKDGKDPNFQEDVYTTFRYKPPLKAILEQLMAEKLSKDDYPYTVEPPSTQTGGGSLRSKGLQTGAKKTGAKIITFVAGGLSYSELRSCYELTSENTKNPKKYMLTIGGSSIISPKTYLDSFSGLDTKDVASMGGIEVVVE